MGNKESKISAEIERLSESEGVSGSRTFAGDKYGNANQKATRSVQPGDLCDLTKAYTKDVLFQHRLVTGCDVLYRDVLQLQRKLDVLDVLVDTIRFVREKAWHLLTHEHLITKEKERKSRNVSKSAENDGFQGESVSTSTVIEASSSRNSTSRNSTTSAFNEQIKRIASRSVTPVRRQKSGISTSNSSTLLTPQLCNTNILPDRSSQSRTSFHTPRNRGSDEWPNAINADPFSADRNVGCRNSETTPTDPTPTDNVTTSNSTSNTSSITTSNATSITNTNASSTCQNTPHDIDQDSKSSIGTLSAKKSPSTVENRFFQELKLDNVLSKSSYTTNAETAGNSSSSSSSAPSWRQVFCEEHPYSRILARKCGPHYSDILGETRRILDRKLWEAEEGIHERVKVSQVGLIWPQSGLVRMRCIPETWVKHFEHDLKQEFQLAAMEVFSWLELVCVEPEEIRRHTIQFRWHRKSIRDPDEECDSLPMDGRSDRDSRPGLQRSNSGISTRSRGTRGALACVGIEKNINRRKTASHVEDPDDYPFTVSETDLLVECVDEKAVSRALSHPYATNSSPIERGDRIVGTDRGRLTRNCSQRALADALHNSQYVLVERDMGAQLLTQIEKQSTFWQEEFQDVFDVWSEAKDRLYSVVESKNSKLDQLEHILAYLKLEDEVISIDNRNGVSDENSGCKDSSMDGMSVSSRDKADDKQKARGRLTVVGTKTVVRKSERSTRKEPDIDETLLSNGYLTVQSFHKNAEMRVDAMIEEMVNQEMRLVNRKRRKLPQYETQRSTNSISRLHVGWPKGRENCGSNCQGSTPNEKSTCTSVDAQAQKTAYRSKVHPHGNATDGQLESQTEGQLKSQTEIQMVSQIETATPELSGTPSIAETQSDVLGQTSFDCQVTLNGKAISSDANQSEDILNSPDSRKDSDLHATAEEEILDAPDSYPEKFSKDSGKCGTAQDGGRVDIEPLSFDALEGDRLSNDSNNSSMIDNRTSDGGDWSPMTCREVDEEERFDFDFEKAGSLGFESCVTEQSYTVMDTELVSTTALTSSEMNLGSTNSPENRSNDNRADSNKSVVVSADLISTPSMPAERKSVDGQRCGKDFASSAGKKASSPCVVCIDESCIPRTILRVDKSIEDQLTTNNFYSAHGNRNFYTPLLDVNQMKSKQIQIPNDLSIAFVYTVAELLLLEFHQALHGVSDGSHRLKLLVNITSAKAFQAYHPFIALQLLYRSRELTELTSFLDFGAVDRHEYRAAAHRLKQTRTIEEQNNLGIEFAESIGLQIISGILLDLLYSYVGFCCDILCQICVTPPRMQNAALVLGDVITPSYNTSKELVGTNASEHAKKGLVSGKTGDGNKVNNQEDPSSLEYRLKGLLTEEPIQGVTSSPDMTLCGLSDGGGGEDFSIEGESEVPRRFVYILLLNDTVNAEMAMEFSKFMAEEVQSFLDEINSFLSMMSHKRCIDNILGRRADGNGHAPRDGYANAGCTALPHGSTNWNAARMSRENLDAEAMSIGNPAALSKSFYAENRFDCCSPRAQMKSHMISPKKEKSARQRNSNRRSDDILSSASLIVDNPPGRVSNGQQHYAAGRASNGTGGTATSADTSCAERLLAALLSLRNTRGKPRHWQKKHATVNFTSTRAHLSRAIELLEYFLCLLEERNLEQERSSQRRRLKKTGYTALHTSEIAYIQQVAKTNSVMTRFAPFFASNKKLPELSVSNFHISTERTAVLISFLKVKLWLMDRLDKTIKTRITALIKDAIAWGQTELLLIRAINGKRQPQSVLWKNSCLSYYFLDAYKRAYRQRAQEDDEKTLPERTVSRRARQYWIHSLLMWKANPSKRVHDPLTGKFLTALTIAERADDSDAVQDILGFVESNS